MASLHWQNADKRGCEEWEYFVVTGVNSLVTVRQDFWLHSLTFSAWTGHLGPHTSNDICGTLHLGPHTSNDICGTLHFRYYLIFPTFLFKGKIIFRYLKSIIRKGESHIICADGVLREFELSVRTFCLYCGHRILSTSFDMDRETELIISIVIGNDMADVGTAVH